MSNKRIEVEIPPKIPKQHNDYDCGVFLLMLVKFKILKWNLEFHSNDMIRIRDMIKVELLARCINQSKFEFTRTSRKRRHLGSPDRLLKKKKSLNLETVQNGQRTLKNPNLESCWTNSCLQLVLVAMDHQENLIQTGSPLWAHLVWLQKKGNSQSLNPIPIRDIVIAKEKQRI